MQGLTFIPQMLAVSLVSEPPLLRRKRARGLVSPQHVLGDPLWVFSMLCPVPNALDRDHKDGEDLGFHEIYILVAGERQWTFF